MPSCMHIQDCISLRINSMPMDVNTKFEIDHSYVMTEIRNASNLCIVG